MVSRPDPRHIDWDEPAADFAARFDFCRIDRDEPVELRNTDRNGVLELTFRDGSRHIDCDENGSDMTSRRGGSNINWDELGLNMGSCSDGSRIY